MASSIADAASREAAWLNAFNDGLPALNALQGGPWVVIQAYTPRTPRTKTTAIYVKRLEFSVERFANVRQKVRHTFHVKMTWPLLNISGSEENEQQTFDNAVNLVTLRILGLPLDKTHGGRFLSVAEEPHFLSYTQEDPEHTVPVLSGFEALFVYHADDPEYFG